MERATQVIDLAGGPVEYRLERRGPRTVLMLHGGHMRAALPLGEDVFADAACTVLAVSRPGYGRTAAGASPDRFADTVADLCGALGIASLAAVVGQSAGGPTAVALAARHPELVERLILQSAVGLPPWPDRRTRAGARAVFGRRTERFTWAAIHLLTRRAPGTAFRLLLPDLTSRPVRELIAGLDPLRRAELLALFGRMRSGAGFAADLRATAPATVERRAAQAAEVDRPTLVIATRDDGSVSFDHAESLADAIPGARLITSTAPSHMIWFGDDYPAVAEAITGFLAPRPA